MNCPNCGTAHEGGATFCASCGAEFHNLESPETGAAPVAKLYKAEFVLGLVGAIIGIVAFLMILIFGLLISFGGGLWLVAAIVAVVCSLVAFILGFAGSGKLNKNIKSGRALLIVAGILSLVACIIGFVSVFMIVGAVMLIPCVVLFLIGGIMAAAKKA